MLSFAIQEIQQVNVSKPIKVLQILFVWSYFCLDSFFILNLLGRSPSIDVENPGNNLYVTGLSPRITKRELEKHFAAEGKVRFHTSFAFALAEG